MANENTVFALSCALEDLASISEYDPKVCTVMLRRCYTRRFATTIFSATQRCNIVATLKRCVALKIVVANRPV